MFNKASNAARFALRWSSYSIGRVLRYQDDIGDLLALFVAAFLFLIVFINICDLVAKWIA